MAVQITGATRW